LDNLQQVHGAVHSRHHNRFRREPLESGSLKPKPEAAYAINAINAIIDGMASITIRKLPENTKRRLRIRAAYNGHSMEQEARELLEAELTRAEGEPLGRSPARIVTPASRRLSRKPAAS
jgi:plasmid stability protein